MIIINNFFKILVLVSIILASTNQYALAVPREDQIQVQQTGYGMELSSPNITLSYTTSYLFYLNVTFNGNLIAGVSLTLEGINYDIGEAVTDYSNGTYSILFSENSTKELPPGIYEGNLVGSHNGTSFFSALELTILSDDVIAPKLTIISPHLIQ